MSEPIRPRGEALRRLVAAFDNALCRCALYGNADQVRDLWDKLHAALSAQQKALRSLELAWRIAADKRERRMEEAAYRGHSAGEDINRAHMLALRDCASELARLLGAEPTADVMPHKCSRCGEPNPDRDALDGCRDPDCPERGAEPGDAA